MLAGRPGLLRTTGLSPLPCEHGDLECRAVCWCCMSATRTQVYFTAQQRHALDQLAAREHKTLAALVREAVVAYLAQPPADPETVLAQTFGALPELELPPRSEWDRGYG
jgi:hypothetical protein